MRPRGSITGPVVLISVGCFFLSRTFWPGFDVFGAVAHYWPFLLIGWGVIGLLEVMLRATAGTAASSGIPRIAWGMVLIVALFGYGASQWNNSGNWWHHALFEKGVQFMGDAHTYSFDPIHRTTGSAPRVVLESFRGDAKITGADTDEVTVSGHKTVRALDAKTAREANQSAEVQISVQGNTIVIRSNQDRAPARTEVSTDYEITVPKSAMIEAVGRLGDFDISNVHSIDLSSDNAGVKVSRVAGDVKIDTRASDDVDCTDVKGTVTLRGKGDDVQLKSIAGQISIVGEYTGTITLRDAQSPVRIDSMHTQFDAQAVPGSLTLQRGSLDASNLVGPLKVNAQATDVTLSQFKQSLDLDVDKGDVELKPGLMPLAHIRVNARSGDVTLAVPQQAAFDLNASTTHGEITNDFGANLTVTPAEQGSTISGKVGSGPEIAIRAEHGNIRLEKGEALKLAHQDDSAAPGSET